MKTTVRFTQAQIRRAVEGAEKSGLKVTGVRVYPDGSIVVETGERPTVSYGQVEKELAASWDDF